MRLTYRKKRPRFLLLSKSDEDLVALARGGSTGAFDELVALHQDRVFALAYRMLGNTEDAADAQQETFVRAWRSLRKFRQDAAFSTWLHRITVNACLSRKRKADREITAVFDEDAVGHSARSGAVACLEKTETAAVVRKVVDGMPAHYRALIVLREIEGRPFEEIAAILGCSVASARTRASKARKMLRDRMRPYFAEEDK